MMGICHFFCQSEGNCSILFYFFFLCCCTINTCPLFFQNRSQIISWHVTGDRLFELTCFFFCSLQFCQLVQWWLQEEWIYPWSAISEILNCGTASKQLFIFSGETVPTLLGLTFIQWENTDIKPHLLEKNKSDITEPNLIVGLTLVFLITTDRTIIPVRAASQGQFVHLQVCFSGPRVGKYNWQKKHVHTLTSFTTAT